MWISLFLVCEWNMYTMKLITYDDGLSYRWLKTCCGVLSYRGLHETGAIQFSQMLLKQVTSNVPQKLSDGHNTKKKVLRCFSMSIATLPTMFSKPYLVYIFLRPSSPTLKEYLLPWYVSWQACRRPPWSFFFFCLHGTIAVSTVDPILFVYILFIYLYVCILYVETLSCIWYSQEKCIKNTTVL